MSDSASTLLTAAILIPIIILLIYAAFRNVVSSARNLKDTVQGGGVRPPQADGADMMSRMAAEFQAQAKKNDDAHKARAFGHTSIVRFRRSVPTDAR